MKRFDYRDLIILYGSMPDLKPFKFFERSQLRVKISCKLTSRGEDPIIVARAEGLENLY
jgi:hypothetical protein